MFHDETALQKYINLGTKPKSEERGIATKEATKSVVAGWRQNSRVAIFVAKIIIVAKPVNNIHRREKNVQISDMLFASLNLSL